MAYNGKKEKLKLKKYPNRRYYDSTHSKHVSLEEIYQLILDGHDIEVCDSKTDEDITVKVLAQIILEHDTAKMDVFSSELLHQILRSNQQLVDDFLERYFNQALSAYLQSQRQFEEVMRQSMNFQMPFGFNNPSYSPDWAQKMMGGFGNPFFNAGANASPEPPPENNHEEKDDLRDMIRELKEEIDDLRKERKKNEDK